MPFRRLYQGGKHGHYRDPTNYSLAHDDSAANNGAVRVVKTESFRRFDRSMGDALLGNVHWQGFLYHSTGSDRRVPETARVFCDRSTDDYCDLRCLLEIAVAV